MAEGKQVSNGEQAEKLLKVIREKEREAQDAKRVWQDRPTSRSWIKTLLKNELQPWGG